MFCIKPAIDAFRVSTEYAMEENSVVDANTELIFLRFVELFTESIPGSCIQMLAFISQRDSPFLVQLSLTSSIFTAAALSCSIS